MKFIKYTALFLVSVLLVFAAVGCNKNQNKPDTDLDEQNSLLLHYSLDETTGSLAKESVSGKDYTINYVFNEQNADNLFKEPNDPLRRPGVKGSALYMDGFSNNIVNRDFVAPTSAITMSAWVAPRVFENIVYYDGASSAAGHTRMTAIINKGDIEMGEGFLLGYGRHGMWGIQLAL